VWYLSRLPCFFGPVHLSPNREVESDFRDELLGRGRNWELHAAFRLVVLGCMLATQSRGHRRILNEAWSQFSQLPIPDLNRLEFLAKHLLDHDLAVADQQWEEWLAYLIAYHLPPSPPISQHAFAPSVYPHVRPSTVVGDELGRLLKQAHSPEQNSRPSAPSGWT